jgi:hypothetical protein
MFNMMVDLFLIEGRILKMLKSLILAFALVCVVLVKPAWPAALTLTVATSKQVYNAGETLQIEGNLTHNGVPVPDGLVLLQINNPKNGIWVVRTLTTGGMPSGPFPVEILNVTSTDSSGLPKGLFNRGQDAGFKVAIKNNAGSSYQVLVMVNLYYSNGVPFRLFPIYEGTIDAGAILTASTWPVTIPANAVAGQATAYASISNGLPNETGMAYGPEKNGTFNIVSGGGVPTPPTNPPGTFTLTIPLTSIPVWLGNYSVYARTYYDFSISSSTSVFTVVLTGDLNHDGTINMKDIAAVARAFGTRPGDPLWNPAADLDNSGKVDMRDVAIVARAFGIVTIP